MKFLQPARFDYNIPTFQVAQPKKVFGFTPAVSAHSAGVVNGIYTTGVGFAVGMSLYKVGQFAAKRFSSPEKRIAKAEAAAQAAQAELNKLMDAKAAAQAQP